MADAAPRPVRIQRPALLAFAIILGIFEGADIASVGLTLSRISRDLDLDPSQGGLCASAGMFGLMIGALVGGRLADIFGRRPVLAVSMIILGLASLGSAASWDFPSLLAMRLVAGLGMGGIMPLLIAMAGESAAPAFRSTAISMLMASGAVGGIAAGIISLYPDWRVVFYFGGLGPLILLPFTITRIVDSGPAPVEKGEVRLSFVQALLEQGRLTGTVLIWAIAFATTLVSYIMINWLPSLLVRQGVPENLSHSAMIIYSLGGIVGNVTAGAVMDRGAPRLAYSLGYAGAALCIVGLASGATGLGLYALAFGLNFCILGAQLVTISLTPLHYPVQARATGIGAMVSAGRLGSVVGPLLVGYLLHTGLAAEQVLLLLLPALGIALILGLTLEAVLRARNGNLSNLLAQHAGAH